MSQPPSKPFGGAPPAPRDTGPKFYPGKGKRPAGVPPVSPSRRRESCELANSPVEIPAITANLGGARALSSQAQESLYFNYPPENSNLDNQRVAPAKEMPRSTTFGFGYNFERAKTDQMVNGQKPRFRPDMLPGEIPRGKIATLPSG